MALAMRKKRIVIGLPSLSLPVPDDILTPWPPPRDIQRSPPSRRLAFPATLPASNALGKRGRPQPDHRVRDNDAAFQLLPESSGLHLRAKRRHQTTKLRPAAPPYGTSSPPIPYHPAGLRDDKTRPG